MLRVVAGYTSSGSCAYENVPAVAQPDGTFLLTGSPGLAQGAAAGDTVILGPDRKLQVVQRGGNLAVQVLGDQFDNAQLGDLITAVECLGGRLDGGHDRVRVFTIPVEAGFPAVEAAFARFTSEHRGFEWYFANVYDEVDGLTPLNWRR